MARLNLRIGRMTRTALVIVVLASVAVRAGAADAPENIARGKPYRLWPVPAYPHCTDAGDRTQLTDGVYTKGYFWTQKTTVGWSNAALATIMVDLGKVEPISGISLNMAAGRAGVVWPMAILLFVGDDEKAGNYIGDLAALSAAEGRRIPDGYAVHKFHTTRLATHGRYLRIVIVATGPYVFSDEIEVYRGAVDLLKRPTGGRRVKDFMGFCRQMQVTWGVRRRLRTDAAAVREQLSKAKVSDASRKRLAAELDDVAEKTKTVTVDRIHNFKTIFPLNDLHRRIYAVQGEIWRGDGPGSAVVWQKNRWAMLSPTEPPRKGPLGLDVHMMRSEYRSGAVNISNSTAQLQSVKLRFEGLAKASARSWIRVHDVPFTDTRSGRAVAAALPDAKTTGVGHVVEIPPGMTRQIWLTFNSKGLAAGKHTGHLVIDPPGLRLPVSVTVYPLTLGRPSLHLCGWDYTDGYAYNVTKANRTALIRMLQEYHVDSPWAQRPTLPTGRFDKTGKMIEPPDDKRFREWVIQWDNARNYLVFASVGETFAGLRLGTAAHKKAVASWAAWWAKRAKSLGVDPQPRSPQARLEFPAVVPKHLGLLLVDEPHSPEQDRVIIEYARIIRDAAPSITIWNDPTWRDPRKASPDLFTLSDTLCPNLPMLIGQGKPFADFYTRQRQAGRELWFYSCSGPGRLLDPYAYHRMQAWFCWKYGATGQGFWAFGDSNGASSWNEYLATRGAYTPLFIDDKTVTRGKHMEAIREGMQDYEYLRMLRERIPALQPGPRRLHAIPPERTKAARKLLASAADRVTATMTNPALIHWDQPKDRTTADAVRIEILKMLTAMEAGP